MRGLILAIALLLALPSYSEEVVVNVDTGLPKVVSMDELRDYFLLKKSHYPNGTVVQVFLFNKDTQVTRNFLLNVLHISSSAYFDMMDGYAATGRSNLPVIVESDTRMVISIAIHKGGIGIIRDAAYAANLTNIKIIEVK